MKKILVETLAEAVNEFFVASEEEIKGAYKNSITPFVIERRNRAYTRLRYLLDQIKEDKSGTSRSFSKKRKNTIA